MAISLDAFRPDVIDQLSAGGCSVLLQPDANGSPWTGQEGIYPAGQQPRDQPLAWLESSWQVTSSQQIRYAVNPMVVGNLLDLSFDGQSAITGPVEEGPSPRSYVMTPPRRGFLALLPWVEDGPPENYAGQGQHLAAHSGHPRENAYRSGVIWADLDLPPLRLRPPQPTAHEEALSALLWGEAHLPRSPLRWGWAVLAAVGLSVWLLRGRLGKLRSKRHLTTPGLAPILPYASENTFGCGPATCGGLAEWLKAAVLKTAVGQPTGGSNPSPSANKMASAVRVLERWVSGLNHSPAKTAYSKGTESSNLSLSAIGACSSAG